MTPALQTRRVRALPEKLPPGQGAKHKDCAGVLIAESGEVFVESAVAQLVEALRYKKEGRGFDSRLGHWYSSLA